MRFRAEEEGEPGVISRLRLGFVRLFRGSLGGMHEGDEVVNLALGIGNELVCRDVAVVKQGHEPDRKGQEQDHPEELAYERNHSSNHQSKQVECLVNREWTSPSGRWVRSAAAWT